MTRRATLTGKLARALDDHAVPVSAAVVGWIAAGALVQGSPDVSAWLDGVTGAHTVLRAVAAIVSYLLARRWLA